ncbi:protein of unknown function [Magnetospirillum sp. XM-1]|uniref:hypothetical protein n=1 Tax=Magnetospirillum sp. XM-1 TaxID=1663591 RepID=UPI00073E067D|nr:hypothetical protein [Magnetospirillum sp. XM-1]CUW41119.1 protein of unknown function [Magnetospirillum sp. XM-1]
MPLGNVVRVIGISETLFVFDAEMPVGNGSDLTEPARRALAEHMISLWTRFRDETPEPYECPAPPAAN